MTTGAATAPGAGREVGFGGPRFVVAVVLLSLGLRLALAGQGGQYYLGDEGRYDRGVQLYLALQAGDFARARAFAMLPEHMLFTWGGAVVTAGQHLLAQFTPYGTWTGHPVHVTFTMWLGAALLSLASTLNVVLTHRLARTLGAGREAAAWALVLAATANAGFYHARHLVPYDSALALGLAALLVGCGGRTPRRAYLAGLLAGTAYGVYNGYWFLVPTLGLAYAAWLRGEPRAAGLCLRWGAGALVALAAPVAFGTAVGGAYYWEILREFSGSATQGSFAEGWSLPWAYLWHAEGPVGVAVIAVTGWAAWTRRTRPESGDAAGLLPLLALGVAYALLVLGANGLHRFVVYGRTVKPFLPLLALAGGWALARLLAGRRGLQGATLGLLAVSGALHFWPHFARAFPREVEMEVLRHWGNPKHTITFAGAIYLPLDLPVSRPDLALVNAQGLYPVHRYLGYPPGRTILRLAHPLSYLPFQYEGHSPRERDLLRTHDISIRLIALADPASVPDDLPAGLRAQPLPPPKKP